MVPNDRISCAAEAAFEGRLRAAASLSGSFAQAIRAIGEPIHSRVAEEISMRSWFMLLSRSPACSTCAPARSFCCCRNHGVVEGVARSLDPKLYMWTVAEPVVREWIERNLGRPGGSKTQRKA